MNIQLSFVPNITEQIITVQKLLNVTILKNEEILETSFTKKL